MSDATRPAPLVPADVDLRGLEYMPLLGARLFGSDFHARATDAEWRAALTLWWAAWQQVPAGSLPDDDVILCRLAELGRDLKGWKKVKARALHGFTLCSDGRLYHRVLCEQALIAWDKRAEDRQKREGEADRKRRERAERSRMFEQLREAGVTPSWNMPTAELRALVTQHVTAEVTQPVTRTVTAKTGRDGTGRDVIPREGGDSSTTVAPAPTDPTAPSGDADPPPTPSLAGRACLALRGANVHDVNPSHPDLLRLLDAGVTPEALGATAAELVSAGKPGRFAYVLRTVERRLQEAASRGRIAAPAAADPMAWASLRSEVVDMGNRLGIGPFEEVDRRTGRAGNWSAYRSRVIAAWRQQQGATA